MNKNVDVKFQQRWDFRRKEDDADSSNDDSKSNSSCGTKNKKHKLVPNLVLPENNEVSDPPICQQHNEPDNGNDVHFKSPETAKKKIKSIKKKQVVQMKSKRSLIKENKKKKRRVSTQERKMLKDLKIFADSLLQELKVAREKMFVQMQEEMRKLVAYGPSFRPRMKDARCSQKNVVHCLNGIGSGVNLQNCSNGSVGQNDKSNVDCTTVGTGVKFDQAIELTTDDQLHKGERSRLSSKTRVTLANNSNQVVSSPYLTLPTVVPKPQLQNHWKGIPLDDHLPAGLPKIKSGSEMDMGKLMNAKTYYGFPTFQLQKQFGSFPQISCNSAGQNGSRMTGSGLRFPIPVLHQGLDIGSNLSTLTESENSCKDNSKVGLRMNGSTVKFPGGSPAFSECCFPNSISSDMQSKTNGEFVAVKLQDLKDGRFYPV